MKKILLLLLALCLTCTAAMAETATGVLFVDPSQSVSVLLPEGYTIMDQEFLKQVQDPENTEILSESGLDTDVINQLDFSGITLAIAPDGLGTVDLMCIPSPGATNRTFALNKSFLDETMIATYESFGAEVISTDLSKIGDLYWYACTISIGGEQCTVYITCTDGYQINISMTDITQEDIEPILMSLQIL